MTKSPLATRQRIVRAMLLLGCLWACGGRVGAKQTPVPSLPTLPVPTAGQAAPAFVLPDTDGKPRALISWRGRPVALFFFCGCAPCHDCARAWADVQQSGELELSPLSAPANPKDRKAARPAAAQPPLTVVVYTGNGKEATRFVAETGLDSKRTVVLTDTEYRAAERYQALACPRLFVLDREGKLGYVGPSPANASTALPTSSLMARAITELRRCQTPAPKLAAPRADKSKGTSHGK